MLPAANSYVLPVPYLRASTYVLAYKLQYLSQCPSEGYYISRLPVVIADEVLVPALTSQSSPSPSAQKPALRRTLALARTGSQELALATST